MYFYSKLKFKTFFSLSHFPSLRTPKLTSCFPPGYFRKASRYLAIFQPLYPQVSFCISQIICLSVFVEGELHKHKHDSAQIWLRRINFKHVYLPKDTRQGSIEGSSIAMERAPARFGYVYLSKCHVLTTASTLGEI